MGQSYFEEGSGLVYLEGLECAGNESALLECPKDEDVEIGLTQCDHSRDVGMRCYGMRLNPKTLIILSDNCF